MKTTISVSFFLRKARMNRAGLAPLYMRIYVGERRIAIITKLNIKVEDWSGVHNKLKATAEDAKRINHQLESFKMRAFDFQRELMNEGKEITLENIHAKWYGIAMERPRMLMEIFTQHNEQMKALVDREFSPLTLERYETSFRHTRAFMQWKFKKDDIDIKALDYKFIADYEFWLKSVRKCDHNTTVKYLSNFKKIVFIGIKNGWLDRDPFVGFKMTKREVERPFLVQEELSRIINKTFDTTRLCQVRDIFVFCWYTGLAYADVEKLTREEITTGIDGEKWIWTNRKKTDSRTRIPLLPPALALIERYKDDPQCIVKSRILPVLTNQKMNEYLKEIAGLCGINKKMTFHTARHTFATTVTLTNGVPIETVGKMLGHKNLKTTQHYARILDLKVSEDMRVLKDKLNPRSETPSPEQKTANNSNS